jgi:hypothetical protein
MATNNYDMLVQLDEKLLNKAMAMVYYKGFLKLEGDYNFVDGVPEELLGFTKMKYKLQLKSEPFVDLRAQNEVYIRISGEMNLVVLTGVPISLDIELNVKTFAEFDLGTRHLNYKVNEVQIISLKLNDKIQMHRNFITKLNQIFGILLNDYFKNTVKVFDIPVAIHGLDLPMMPNNDSSKLPVSRIDVNILDNKTLAIGINFFNDSPTASLSGQFTDGRELYFGIRKTTLTDIFNFWWDKTTFNKTKEFTGQTNIGFDATLEKGVDLATRILSLGFIESDTNYENVVLDYGGTIRITNKPEFDFHSGDTVKLSKLVIKTDLFAKMTADVFKDIFLDTSSFVPDSVTPWEDDKKLKNINERKEILNLKDTFDLEITDAEGRLAFNDDNHLVIKIQKADFSIDFKHKGTAFTKRMWENLMTFIKERVIEKIPEIVLSPSLILSKVNIYGFSAGIDETSLVINPDEINIHTNIIINELKSLPVAVPLYIANQKSKIIHKFECPLVGDIEPNNRIGYFVIYEALSEHYKTCKSCLSAYHIY